MKQPESFSEIIEKLQRYYGKPAPPKIKDVLGLVIHESIAYLVTDEKRDAAFQALRKQVGLRPTDILSALDELLIEISRLGGVQPERRAARLREIAHIALQDFDGEADSALKLPLPQARKKLQLFPSIGVPGAEKILLFTKTHPVLALESNGLRVLLRLGFGEEKKSYGASYTSVQQAVAHQIGEDCEFLIRAVQLLRQHGKELCRRNNPICEKCPVRSTCAYYLQFKSVKSSNS